MSSKSDFEHVQKKEKEKEKELKKKKRNLTEQINSGHCSQNFLIFCCLVKYFLPVINTRTLSRSN